MPPSSNVVRCRLGAHTSSAYSSGRSSKAPVGANTKGRRKDQTDECNTDIERNGNFRAPSRLLSWAYAARVYRCRVTAALQELEELKTIPPAYAPSKTMNSPAPRYGGFRHIDRPQLPALVGWWKRKVKVGVGNLEGSRMSSNLERETEVDLAADDPFLKKIRALRESLPTGSREIRYRLEEMERRLRDMCADSRIAAT